VEEAVNRLSCLQAGGGFFPDVYDESVSTVSLVQFMQQYGDEQFLRSKDILDVPAREVAWRKGRALRTYNRLLQRYRDWGKDADATADVPTTPTQAARGQAVDTPASGVRWAVETEHDGSDDEEGVTVQVLSLDEPGTGAMPMYSRKRKHEMKESHRRHAEEATKQLDTLAALHWRKIRDEGVDHDDADIEEIRSTIELLQHEISRLRTAAAEDSDSDSETQETPATPATLATTAESSTNRTPGAGLRLVLELSGKERERLISSQLGAASDAKITQLDGGFSPPTQPLVPGQFWSIGSSEAATNSGGLLELSKQGGLKLTA
jgi:hypothetical protein